MIPNDEPIIYIDANPKETCIWPSNSFLPIREPITSIITHNEAEWIALKRALYYIDTYSFVRILSDSELIVRQFNGEYKINLPTLKNRKIECEQIIANRGLDVVVQWIPREQNRAGRILG